MKVELVLRCFSKYLVVELVFLSVIGTMVEVVLRYLSQYLMINTIENVDFTSVLTYLYGSQS